NYQVQAVPVNPPFSLTSAFELLMYSYSAYCPLKEVSNWTCAYCNTQYTPAGGLEIVSTFDHVFSNTFGYIGITDNTNTVVMAFRGTQGPDLRNWITNLNFPQVSPYPADPSAMVHRGFLAAYNHVQKATHEGLILAQQKCPHCTRFVATGHSLGGALAILAVADVYPSIISLPLEMYTYGSPRVGNPAFNEYFESTALQSIWRVVNYHDIVPHLPTKEMGFHHLPTEVWIKSPSNHTEYVICNGSGEDPHCSDHAIVALSIPEHLDYLGIEKQYC
ncbi:hypothetical protein SAMD00019534_064160, partial [Acytostelium subglobosum LB1]|uniref:hypothetical protein n=1 Tax=Acytostelium subglobosum LB1 TaxID=1410327 RepID=UPI0006450B4F